MLTHMAALILVLLQDPSAPGELKLVGMGSLRHPSSVTAISITPDSRIAFAALDDGTLLAYEMESRKPRPVAFRSFSAIKDMAITTAGDRLVVVDGNLTVSMLDVSSLNVVAAVRLKSEPDDACFSIDGASLYVSMLNGHLLKLKSADLTVQADIFPTEGSLVVGLACSPDGLSVATSDNKGEIKLWSAESLALQQSWKAHDRWATVLKFDPSGEHLVSGGVDPVLKVWKVSDRSLVRECKDYHQEEISSIAFSPDGRMVSGGQDGLCQFWEKGSFEAGKSYPGYRGYIAAGAISKDGKWLVRGGSSLDFVPMDHPDRFERVADYGGAILGFAVTPDLKGFVTGSLDRRLIVWRIEKGITSNAAVLDDWITAVDYCGDFKSVAAGLADGRVEVYSAATLGRESTWTAHRGRVQAVASVGANLVSAGEDGALKLWDLSGRLLSSFELDGPCRSLAARGNLIAVASSNGGMAIYDADSKSLVKRLQGRPLSATSLAFSRDGRRLFAGYFDGGLESFDIETGTAHEYSPGDGESALSIAVNPTNDLLAVGYRDGHARIFDSVSLKAGPAAPSVPAREILSIRWILGPNSFAGAGASHSVIFRSLKGDVEAWLKKIRGS